jgi:large subunit ribosomal protein L3
MNKKLGLVGKKVGMTRIFAEDGHSIPVTVLDMSNNRIIQIKQTEVDGYTALQLGFGQKKISRVNKAEAGHFSKAGVPVVRRLQEFRVSSEVAAQYQLGQQVEVSLFNAGQLVDVTGTTKGRGFSGVIRRHNFSSNNASHGNSISHNKPGSIGQAQDPGRVFPGKKMPGQYGADRRTVQNLEVIRVDIERQLIFVKGAVPGSTQGLVLVRPSVKAGE